MWSRFISSSLKLTQTEENKHVEFENDFHGLIAVTFTSSSGRKREIIENGSYERIPYQMERRDDCRTSREGYTRKWIWRHTEEVSYETRETRGGMWHIERAARIISSLPLPSFFFPSFIPLVRSFTRSRGPGEVRVFTANIPKKRLHVTTRWWIQKVRVRFLPDSYGVSFCHILSLPLLSLKASSPLKRDVWKKNYVCAATYTQFGNVKSCAVDSFNNGSS